MAVVVPRAIVVISFLGGTYCRPIFEIGLEGSGSSNLSRSLRVIKNDRSIKYLLLPVSLNNSNNNYNNIYSAVINNKVIARVHLVNVKQHQAAANLKTPPVISV